jgi:hypothetical protein
VDLAAYGTVGIIEFTSNHGSAVEARATRQFQEQIHAAQPGARILELGSREAVLAAVGRGQLDVEAYKKIGQQYGVKAVFVGEVVYSEPKFDVRVPTGAQGQAGVRATIRADASGRLVETATGAGVWSDSSWATREVARVSLSPTYGVSGGTSTSSPHEEMVTALVRYLAEDFRPGYVRKRVD